MTRNQKRVGSLWIALLGLLVVSTGAQGVEVQSLPSEVASVVERLPIQHNGRVKPFDSFARETLDLITDSRTFGQKSPTETVLHIITYPEKWESEPLLSIPFRPLRLTLGLSAKEGHLSYNGLFAASFMKRLPPIVQKQQAQEKLTFLENETMDLYSRFVALHGLLTGELRMVPSGDDPESVWLKLTDREEIQLAWQGWLSAYREGNKEKMLKTLRHFTETVSAAHPSTLPKPWRLSLEVRYNQIALLHWAWMGYGLCALLFGVSLSKHRRNVRPVALVFLIGSLLVLHVGGIATRCVLAGRPPVSNFYESMLWLAFVTVLLGSLFELRNKNSYFGLASAIFGGVTLLVSEHVPLDPSVQPIVAVLRSNYWLSIHVLTIVASYGVLTLATGIAHCYAGSFLFRKKGAPASLGESLYRVIQVGVILLSAGIMLGAVWANASWGRYWGWDPKETWALITLLWFLALLHARKAGWIAGKGLAIGTILGFFLLLMTYYGVSFYLIGLHSYAGGHATPIPPLLIVYLIAELIFIALINPFLSPRKWVT